MLAEATSLYVDPVSGSDTQTCGSQQTACHSVSHAVQMIPPSTPTEVILAPGLYTGDLNCGVAVSNKSVVIRPSPSGGAPVIRCPAAFWLEANNATLQLLGPLTIANCTRSAVLASLYSTVVISGAQVVNNSVSVASANIGGGAAIAVTGGSSLIVSDSVFVGNNATATGACVGSSACTVAGGAVYIDANSTLLSVANCTCIGNTVASAGAAAVYGGAVASLNNASVVIVSGSVFSGNSGSTLGASQYTAGGALNVQGPLLIVVNSSFTGNSLSCAGKPSNAFFVVFSN